MIASFVTRVALGCAWASLLAFAQDPTDIATFAGCLNKNLVAPGNRVDISNSTQCFPAGCMVTLTMSTSSAQSACVTAGVQLPRVILSCPGPAKQQRLRPSYDLCNKDNNRIEVGEDQAAPKGAAPDNMKMADIVIPPNAVLAANFDVSNNPATSILDIYSDAQGTDSKGCQNCHTTAGVPAINTPAFSAFIDPFGKFGTTDLEPFVIFTSQNTKKVAPKAPAMAQTLANICTAIGAANFPVGMVPNAALCNNLQGYKAALACGTQVAPGGNALACTGVVGGGTFLGLGDNNIPDISVMAFEIDGQAQMVGATQFQFADIDGGLTIFNYGTHTLIQSVLFDDGNPTVNIYSNGDSNLSASGVASVNGVSTPISFSMSSTAGTVAYQLYSNASMSPVLLASGTGQSGASLQSFYTISNQ